MQMYHGHDKKLYKLIVWVRSGLISPGQIHKKSHISHDNTHSVRYVVVTFVLDIYIK
jgi:hypothetical protein